jgi:hypothetical protein
MSLPTDAGRHATALADLAEAGPQALARHLDSHTAAWRSSTHVIPQPEPQTLAMAQRAGTAPGGNLAVTGTGQEGHMIAVPGPVDQDLPRYRETGAPASGPATVMLPMRTLSCGCMGWPAALSARPATTFDTCWPRRVRMITPGTPSATSWSAACCSPAGG